MNCPRCGTSNGDQASFCQACGFDLKTVIVEPGPSIAAANNQSAATPGMPGVPGVQIAPFGIIAPVSVRYAGFWVRFLAALIDGVIISIVTAPIFIVIFISNIFSERSGNDVIPVFIAIVGNIVYYALWWIYYAVMESSSKQGTLGKMFVGLKVTDLNGNRISFGRATGRFFGRILSGLILDIGFLMIAFNDKKQGLHDMIAGTLVVKK